MPAGKMTVDPEQTAQTSQDLQRAVEELQSQLANVQGKVDALLSDGYQTPQAQQRFQPMHDHYQTQAKTLNETLGGISRYLQQVGDSFSDTDQQLGSSMGQ